MLIIFMNLRVKWDKMKCPLLPLFNKGIQDNLRGEYSSSSQANWGPFFTNPIFYKDKNGSSLMTCIINNQAFIKVQKAL